MAIYRPPRPRWPLAAGVGVACLLVGSAVGLALGGRPPDPEEVARDLRSDLVAAAGSLEVAEIEYAESVSGGEVTREAEYEGALDAIASSQARYEEVAPAVASVAPSRAEEIAVLYDQCEGLMRDRARPRVVGPCFDDLRGLLTGER